MFLALCSHLGQQGRRRNFLKNQSKDDQLSASRFSRCVFDTQSTLLYPFRSAEQFVPSTGRRRTEALARMGVFGRGEGSRTSRDDVEGSRNSPSTRMSREDSMSRDRGCRHPRSSESTERTRRGCRGESTERTRGRGSTRAPPHVQQSQHISSVTHLPRTTVTASRNTL